MELQDVAAKNAALVAELDAKLRRVVGSPAVSARVVGEGRENVKRWMSPCSSASQWQAEVSKAYAGFTDADMQHFERWVRADGEHAPRPL